MKSYSRKKNIYILTNINMDSELISFWQVQIFEHTVIIEFLTVGEAKEIALKYYKFINNSLTSGTPIGESVVTSFNNYLRWLLTEHSNEYNSYLSLITHMISEHEYYLGLLRGDLTDEQHLYFWCNESAEHTSLISNSIDPNVITWRDDGRIKQISGGWRDTIKGLKLADSLRWDNTHDDFKDCLFFVEDVDNERKKGELSINIPQYLINHEKREAKMGYKFLTAKGLL